MGSLIKRDSNISDSDLQEYPILVDDWRIIIGFLDDSKYLHNLNLISIDSLSAKTIFSEFILFDNYKKFIESEGGEFWQVSGIDFRAICNDEKDELSVITKHLPYDKPLRYTHLWDVKKLVDPPPWEIDDEDILPPRVNEYHQVDNLYMTSLGVIRILAVGINAMWYEFKDTMNDPGRRGGFPFIYPEFTHNIAQLTNADYSLSNKR